jgi:hypothetical protein
MPGLWRATIAKIRTADDLSNYLDVGLEQHALTVALSKHSGYERAALLVPVRNNLAGTASGERDDLLI